MKKLILSLLTPFVLGTPAQAELIEAFEPSAIVTCKRIPLIVQDLSVCDTDVKNDNSHGSQEICLAEEKLVGFINKLEGFSTEGSKTIRAEFALEDGSMEAQCQKDSTSPKEMQRCEFENGVIVNWFITQQDQSAADDHLFVIFASGENSPTYRAETWFGQECVANQ